MSRGKQSSRLLPAPQHEVDFQKLSNEKVYFSIGDVCRICSVSDNVLRYWERMFPDLQPVRRGEGSRRAYKREHLLLVRKIRGLVYDEGYTAKGAADRLNKLKGSAAESPKSEEGLMKSLLSQLQCIADSLQ